MRGLRRSFFGVVTVLTGASIVVACDFLTADLDAYRESPADAAAPESSDQDRDVMPGDAADAADATIDAPTDDAGMDRCPSKGGAMIVVPRPSDAGTYCVDATEVTNRAYQEFLQAAIAPSTQPPKCSWNGSFQPDLVNAACPSNTFDPVGRPERPVVCIDWCDAHAFCAWAGKRLCGGFGADGGPAVYLGAPAGSQWRWACSKGGAREYPYGASYLPTACNGKERDAGVLLDAGTLPGCVGGYPGLRDMSGNAWEWVDACENDTSLDAGTICQTSGGSYGELGGQLTCEWADKQPRRYVQINLGLRCCAD